MVGSIKNRIAGESGNLFTVSPLRFLIFLFLFGHAELVSASLKSNNSTNPGDSAKNKYDINDPRNPHCPCHQYQKLADEEYAKLQSKEKKGIVSILNGGSQNSGKNLGKQNGSANLFWFYHKKKKFAGKNPKAKGYGKMKYKISDKLSRCFHF